MAPTASAMVTTECCLGLHRCLGLHPHTTPWSRCHGFPVGWAHSSEFGSGKTEAFLQAHAPCGDGLLPPDDLGG
ncbi:hypothetical protein OAO87_02120 [bacterium]|nr:hypothetical protein [bacterium]